MIENIPLNLLVPNDYNPRKHFDDARMKELEKSIKNQGIVQAITVRPLNGKYEVVAGIRRYLAAKAAGLKEIPAMVKILTDEEAIILSITENLERSDLTPMEEARAFQVCLGWDEQHHFEDGRTEGLRTLVDELSEKLPMSRNTIYNRLSLLHLPESLQTKIDQGQLTIKTAEAITRLKALWEIKTKNLTDEEIEKRRPQIKEEIQATMESIAENLHKNEDGITTDEDGARERVNNYLNSEQKNLAQREEGVKKLKQAYQKAEEKLLNYVKDAKEFPTDFNQMTLKEKTEWYKKYLDENIKQLSDKDLDKLNKERAVKTAQHDNYLMNLSYVKELALDTCPHCGAGIHVQNLEKRISELSTEIKAINAQENEAGSELKDYRKRKSDLEKILREYNSAEKVYKVAMNQGGP